MADSNHPEATVYFIDKPGDSPFARALLGKAEKSEVVPIPQGLRITEIEGGIQITVSDCRGCPLRHAKKMRKKETREVRVVHTCEHPVAPREVHIHTVQVTQSVEQHHVLPERCPLTHTKLVIANELHVKSTESVE